MSGPNLSAYVEGCIRATGNGLMMAVLGIDGEAILTAVKNDADVAAHVEWFNAAKRTPAHLLLEKDRERIERGAAKLQELVHNAYRQRVEKWGKSEQ